MHIPFVDNMKEWFQKRRDRRAATFTDYTDICELYKRNLLTARGTGQSITEISARITSRVRHPLKVVINHGTYFVSSGAHQNMVSRRKYRFILNPLEDYRISIPASCINAHLPIPNEKDRFSGVAMVSGRLAGFLEAAENEDAMTIQAGVWAITDDYSGYEVQQHLRVRRMPRYGTSTGSIDEGSAVSDLHIKRARAILSSLNIHTRL